MCHIISSKVISYPALQTVKVADKEYPDIHTQTVKDLIDADNKRKQFYVLEGIGSKHSAYVENNVVTRSEEYFDKPRTMRIGDEVYTNITAKLNLAGTNYDTYIMEDPRGKYNCIRYREQTGAILDESKIHQKAIIRNVLSSLKKVAQIFH